MTWYGCSFGFGKRIDLYLDRMRIIFGTMVYRYFGVIGPHIWHELRDNTFIPLQKSEKEHDEGVRAHRSFTPVAVPDLTGAGTLDSFYGKDVCS